MDFHEAEVKPPTFISPNVRMVGIVSALVPLIVIYPLAQRYFVEGIILGATKE